MEMGNKNCIWITTNSQIPSYPMLTDVLSVMKKHGLERAEVLGTPIGSSTTTGCPAQTDDLSGKPLIL
ncbi:MAG: hypothetical protein ACLUVG_16545 [Phocaeicola vulgatus]